MESLFYLVIGIFAGFLSGLFGIGGGVISVPCLFFTFHYFHPSDPSIMHTAVGTSLASMVFSSLSSFIGHYRKKTVSFFLLKYITMGAVFGGIAGPIIAFGINENILQLIFGLFLCYCAFHFFNAKESSHLPHIPKHPKKSFLTLVGFLISTLASLLGIGGGFFTMPLLSKLKYSFHTCVGTSAAVSFVITCFGSIAYIIVGLLDPSQQGIVEYINIKAFILVSIMGVIFAPIGVKALHQLHPRKTKVFFGFIVGLVGIYMILRSPFFLDIIR